MNDGDDALALQRELLQTLKEALRAQSEALAAQRQVIEQLRSPQRQPAASDKADRSFPHDKDWRRWRGFCLSMQRLAGEVLQLQRGRGPVRKFSVAERASVSDKTISRAMRGYGLDPVADWPPFDWNPEEHRDWHNPDERK